MASNKDDAPRKGTLVMEGAPFSFKLVACNYSVFKPMKGEMPVDGPQMRYGSLRVTVETDKNTKFLREWALKDDVKFGTISMVITAGKSGSRDRKLRYIYFGGRVESIHEFFNNQNSQMMATELHIYPSEVYFADSDGMSVGLITENGTVEEDKMVPLNSTSVHMQLLR